LAWLGLVGLLALLGLLILLSLLGLLSLMGLLILLGLAGLLTGLLQGLLRLLVLLHLQRTAHGTDGTRRHDAPSMDTILTLSSYCDPDLT
jgi:hypothetical protein